MSIWAVLLVAVGVSADAFAVALGKGLSLHPCRQRDALALATTFGGFQAGMPLLGWLLGSGFAPYIAAVDHWVAFALLGLIGINMIIESLRRDHDPGDDESSLSLRSLLVLGVATSIDALIVGVGLALLEVQVGWVVTTIGITTFVLSYIGVLVGRRAGDRFGAPAGVVGGVILVALGLSTLLEHLRP